MFQKLGAKAEDLPAVIFSSIGRTVFRDIGLTAYAFRLIMKFVDYNFLTCIICLIAPYMADFKGAMKEPNRRRVSPASNGRKQY